jgi:hypothetical protein
MLATEDDMPEYLYRPHQSRNESFTQEVVKEPQANKRKKKRRWQKIVYKKEDTHCHSLILPELPNG